MRWLLLVLVSLVAVAMARPPQTRPRSTRGFKNVALSTARGFGKRAEPDQTTVPRLRAEWLADEMADNPGLARLFIRRFVDANSDGMLTPVELMDRSTGEGH